MGSVANAQTTGSIQDLGTLTIGDALPFSGYVAPGFATFGDVFDFSLPASGGSAYSVVNFPLDIPAGTFNVIFSSMALISVGPDGVRGGGDDVTLVSDTGQNAISLTFGPTSAPANMYLLVNGLADGTLGGLYSGAISVSPVPEPEVWAMMLIGAGLVGFRLRNRSKRIAANRFA